MTARSGFPSTGDDDVAFSKWVNHFVTKNGSLAHQTDDRCYHPANYQARHLTCKVKNAHNVVADTFEPKFVKARSTYWTFDAVFIVDLFHESKCVFFNRLLATNNSQLFTGQLQDVQDYVWNQCRCDREDSPSQNDTIVTHHTEGHRVSTLSLPAGVLRRVDELTRSDAALFRVALIFFLKEVKFLETRLGRRVLCDDVLQKKTLELAYVMPNLTGTYRSARPC